MSTFIFDFDGTLANTVEILFHIANGLADEFGFVPMDEVALQRLRGMSSREILQEGHISIWKLPQLVRRIKREQQARLGQIQMVEGMPQVLVDLKARGDLLGIATSNSKDTLYPFLQSQDLLELFDFTMTGITLFGKARALRKLLRQHQLDPVETIYVGDEVRDMQAAQEVGVHSLGVSWGFNTVAALEAANAEFVIENPQDILRLALSTEQDRPCLQRTGNRQTPNSAEIDLFSLEALSFPQLRSSGLSLGASGASGASFEAKSIL